MYLIVLCNKVALIKTMLRDLYSGTSNRTQSVATGAAKFAFDTLWRTKWNSNILHVPLTLSRIAIAMKSNWGLTFATKLSWDLLKLTSNRVQSVHPFTIKLWNCLDYHGKEFGYGRREKNRLHVVPLLLSLLCMMQKKATRKNGHTKSWGEGMHKRRDCYLLKP